MPAGDALYCLGIDVGTGSARAGDLRRARQTPRDGRSHRSRSSGPQEDFVEQSSDDIWQRVRQGGARGARARRQIGPAERDRRHRLRRDLLAGRCSTQDDRPVTVSPTGDDEQNVIVWMDHRAIDESRSASTRPRHDGAPVRRRAISPEMETPKLLWLKEHLPDELVARARGSSICPIFSTYRATGIDVRSLCTTVCKWTYLGHEATGGRWDDSYFPRRSASAISPTRASRGSARACARWASASAG